MATVHRVLGVGDGSSVRLVSYAPGERFAPHVHAATTVTLLVRGSVEEQVGSARWHARPLSLVVKPAGTEHADTFGPMGALTLQVRLPRAVERAMPACGSLATWRWLDAPPAARSLIALLRALRLRESATLGAWAEARLGEALRALSPAGSAGVAAPAWLTRARSLLDLGGESIRGVARTVGVHPVHLAHAFRRHHGLGPAEFRRRRRLQRAAEWIADSDRPLVEIAYECGFSDQAHLTRALTSHLGVAPAAFRRLSAVT